MAGLDGCRAGWVLATTPANAGVVPRVEVRVIDGLEVVVDELVSGRLCAAGIDIPIGLPPAGPRSCDVEARRMLGPRRGSVFPSPARPVLAAADYPEACTLSRVASGTAISKQLFNILPKIREVDRVLARAPELRARVFEMCPELSFTVLAGTPMHHAKRSADGRAERLATLRPVFGDVRDARGASAGRRSPRRRAGRARRSVDGEALRERHLPPPRRRARRDGAPDGDDRLKR